MGVQISDVNRWYEERVYQPDVAEYYDQSDFYNFGYWLKDTADQKQACENLMEKLLSFVSEKRGRLLDVACGRGATTAYFSRHYRPSDVTGVDVSHRQLGTARRNAPGCGFRLMDATQLAFADRSFDSVTCVEAAFHFDTREAFLREACRVLKPGGSLVLTDILAAKWAERGRRIRTQRNYVPSLQAYRDLYLEAGFESVDVVDATLECWTRFYRQLLRWHWRVILWRERDVRTFTRFLLQILVANRAVRHYLLVSARKA